MNEAGDGGYSLDASMDAIARRAVELAYARRPELWNRFGDEGRKKSLRDMRYHIAYLNEAIGSGEKSLFLDYLDWVSGIFVSIGLPSTALTESLECLLEALHELGQDQVNAERMILEGITRTQASTTMIDSYRAPHAQHGELADRYMGLLLEGDSRAAGLAVGRAVEDGTPLKDVYLHVFQPVLWEIGRLWQTGAISVAKEHFCTAATSMIMARLMPEAAAPSSGLRVVSACVGSELHNLGIRMVSDFFEMDGWETRYLGASTPAASIVETVKEWKADILALSVTMTFHLPELRSVVAAARTQALHGLKIIVGGYPFRLSKDLWQSMGADGCGRDAQEAVTVAASLVG